MAFTVTSNSFKDGDYLSNDFVLSADFGFTPGAWAESVRTGRTG